MQEKRKSWRSGNMIFTAFLYCLIMYCILFPADKLNIKEIILAGALLFCYCGRRSRHTMRISIFGYGIVYTAISLVYSLARGVAIGSALSYGYVWLYVLLLTGIIECSQDIKRPFFTATFIVAGIIDIIFLGDLLGIVSIFENPIAVFFKSINELQGLGKGELSTFGYSIFYKSCPLIVVAYSYFIFKRKYIAALPLLVALFVCGTRANFLIAVFLTASIPVLCTEKFNVKLIALLVVLGVGLIVLPVLQDRLTTLNNLKRDRSETIKIQDMMLIWDNMKSNPLNLLFGTGVGSEFLSSRGKMMATFEISYFDYFRQTGLFGLIVLLKFIITPVRWLYANERWLFLAYISYLAISFTNPLLVTSTSFMLYLVVYGDYMRSKRKRIL